MKDKKTTFWSITRLLTFIIVGNMEATHDKKDKLQIYWKLLAFFLPVYFIYGPILPDETKRSKTFWKYIMAGFVFYLVIIALLSFGLI